MTKNTLIVFTRNPKLGQVKTRLAKTIGEKAALNIYEFLLQHTEKTIRNIAVEKIVFYSETIGNDDIWNPKIYQKRLQYGNDLGQKMHNAIQSAFNSGSKKIVIIGSDLLDLTPQIIEQAFEKLDQNQVVIGPANDGGYYLLGVKAPHKSIFKNKQWGTKTVLSDTLDDLKKESVFLLKQLNDIDTFEDMKHYQSLKPFYTNHD